MTENRRQEPNPKAPPFVPAEPLVDKIDRASGQIADRIEVAGYQISEKVETLTDTLSEVKERLGESLGRIGEAAQDFGKSTERPATKLARALDDFMYELKRGVERAASSASTAPPKKSRGFFRR